MCSIPIPGSFDAASQIVSIIYGEATIRPPPVSTDERANTVHPRSGGQVDKRASIERWEMFLSLPINHDPELEKVREQCLLIAYGDERLKPAGEGLDGGIFDRRGIARIKEVSNGLEGLIKSEPASKFF